MLSVMKNLMLEDIFLNHLRRDRIPVTVDLRERSIEGTVRGFDNSSIIMDTQNGQIMLYKNNILSIDSGSVILTDEKRLAKE